MWIQRGAQEASSKRSYMGEIEISTLESVPSGKWGDKYLYKSGVCGEARGYA